MRAAEARKLLKQFDIAGASEPANIRQFDGGLSNCNALKL